MITERTQIQKIRILSELPTGGAADNLSRIDKVRPASRVPRRDAKFKVYATDFVRIYSRVSRARDGLPGHGSPPREFHV